MDAKDIRNPVSEVHHININAESYKIFYYVAKENSISKTAEKLFITQPAVSRTISQLEKQIGCMGPGRQAGMAGIDLETVMVQ